MKKRPANKKTKVKGYSHGGKVETSGGRGIMKTNQATVKAKGMGAATRGGNFKV
jgi:hypothetical protein|tara:strand:+ start:135 stop:296 length:162 start_codon:yes stop_codon:yes gene_type:complete